MEHPTSNNILTVTELNTDIKALLEGSFPSLWVRGEISNLRRQSSGHLYFSLKDASSQISVVIFKGDASRLSLRVEDGMQVIAYGSLSVYTPRGNYQLIVRELLDDGKGNLQLEFERLKAKLNEEGLFAPERKKAIPLLPSKVGFVTSPTGAALRDFLSILRRRSWQGTVIVFPAVVQGKEGAASIIRMMELADQMEDLDLLVIGRGGGSLEDLWNFNEEASVRAVAGLRVPVISAVGHEIDFVLTDFAADKRAETPSAAAELISSGQIEIQNRLKNATQQLGQSLTLKLERKKAALEQNRLQIEQHSPLRYIETANLRIDELQERLQGKLRDSMNRLETQFTRLEQGLNAYHPQPQIQNYQQQINSLEQTLKQEHRHQSDTKKQTLNTLEHRLENLDYNKVIQRGYVLMRDRKGKVISESEALKNAQRIKGQFKDGEVELEVIKDNQLDLISDLSE